MYPYMVWKGKTGNSIKVDTVSIHVHERIDPGTIIEKIKQKRSTKPLHEFFDTDVNTPDEETELQCYQHERDWCNRMIAGDSLLVMNSLITKENMRGKAQMIYFDPPYGIKYGSNFQPYMNQMTVKDGNDDDLTKEPEMIKAFRDSWEYGVHSYLSYMRDRLLLARELLTESGSVFVQISDEHVHRIRVIMDEIFGYENFMSMIMFRRKNNSFGANLITSAGDYILWYAKDKKQIKYHKLYEERKLKLGGLWDSLELPDGTRRKLKKEEIDNPNIIKSINKVFREYTLAPSRFTKKNTFNVTFKGKSYEPPYSNGGKSWKITENGMNALVEKNRVTPHGNTLQFIGYWDDFSYNTIDNMWNKSSFSSKKTYVVETSINAVQRCMLMCTDPGDLVIDPTCGSGTTSYVAEKYGRRYITCDTSRVALSLAQRRLITSVFDYYKLERPKDGVCKGFNYKTIDYNSIGSIANDEKTKKLILYDKPLIDTTKKRISGPFTMESIPAPNIKSIDILNQQDNTSQYQSYQQEWQDELKNSSVLLRNNKKLEFNSISNLQDMKWLHCTGDTKETKSRKAVISFGPPHAPLTYIHVKEALKEVNQLKPDIIIFIAMQFDPEVNKKLKTIKKNIPILQVNMNTDLLVKDLKKKQVNESFWQVGQPDVELISKDKNEYIVKVHGYDYHNTKTNKTKSENIEKISMWMLDTNYNGRYVTPEQIFLTMNTGNNNNEFLKLKNTLKGIIDEDKLQTYIGKESLPFKVGPNKKIAVKIIDNKGISTIDVIDIK